MILKIFTTLYFVFLFLPPLYGKMSEDTEAEASEAPPRIDNFLLSPSQQLSPLMSFGQNIMDAGQVQLYVMSDHYVGAEVDLQEIVGSAVYAPTDDFSIYLNVPATTGFKHGGTRSSGWEDIFLQFEYAFFSDQTSSCEDQATFVANVTIPTGKAKKTPPTGGGDYRFLLGGTLSRMYMDWYLFTSPGAILPTPHNGNKLGNQFLYQAGVGRFLFSIDSDWIVAFLVEADGQYSQHNQVQGAIDPDSGGNIVTITPSLWVSSEHLIIQLGVGFFAAQHLFGNQDTDKYFLAANLGWTF